MACEQQIRFTAALHRGRLSVAEHAINNLASVNRLEAAFWSASYLTFIFPFVTARDGRHRAVYTYTQDRNSIVIEYSIGCWYHSRIVRNSV